MVGDLLALPFGWRWEWMAPRRSFHRIALRRAQVGEWFDARCCANNHVTVHSELTTVNKVCAAIFTDLASSCRLYQRCEVAKHLL